MTTEPPFSGRARKPKDVKVIEDGRTMSDEGLVNAFDPMKNLHLWTMWRTAVNGRLVDDSKAKTAEDFVQHPLGKALVKPPLSRFIKFDDGSMDIAEAMMDPQRNGNYRLPVIQFVFYGVPRVVLKK